MLNNDIIVITDMAHWGGYLPKVEELASESNDLRNRHWISSRPSSVMQNGDWDEEEDDDAFDDDDDDDEEDEEAFPDDEDDFDDDEDDGDDED